MNILGNTLVIIGTLFGIVGALGILLCSDKDEREELLIMVILTSLGITCAIIGYHLLGAI